MEGLVDVYMEREEVGKGVTYLYPHFIGYFWVVRDDVGPVVVALHLPVADFCVGGWALGAPYCARPVCCC